jgi:hypothetical protein
MAVHALNCIDNQQLTVGAAAVGLTKPTTKRPRHVLIYVGGTANEKVRFLIGEDPTATLGIVVLVGDYIDLTDPMMDASGFIDNVKFIRDTGNASDCTLDIEYFD